MTQGINLNNIYKLRKDFTIIGLTGQTGSGCSEVSSQLVKGFGDGSDFENPKRIYTEHSSKFIHNDFRKHRIVYNYAEENFDPFTEIKYKDIITLFLIKYPFNDLENFLRSIKLKDEFINSDFPIYDLSNEIKIISLLKNQFNKLSEEIIAIELDKVKDKKNWKELNDFFIDPEFKEFSKLLHEGLGKNSDNSGLNYHKTIQIISNNLRKSGVPYDFFSSDADNIFSIVEVINSIIKSYRSQNKEDRTQIVINSLKNPLEIMFFKERYSAFYSFAINKAKERLKDDLGAKYGTTINIDDVLKLLDEEYNGAKNEEFFKQNIEECLQLADIHISFLSPEKTRTENENNTITNVDGKLKKFKTNVSPYFSWQDQLLKYVSLINHPGLITPSPEERCMQLAYTAKHNSGCISRHVGAAITDEEYSVKAIGWNNTPSGQVPCLLRNAEDLIDPNFDIDAFTDYERGSGTNFKEAVELHYKENIKNNKKILKGRNVCFCFKSLQNSISEGKNQVHTRSLHAEESAFLQITKYGGIGIKNGILFSTASPCELCSKKAYQLGIKIIYYIDPYPGISISHILSAGDKPIKVRLFNGAIGSAYHKIYHPMMSYKDELSLLLGQNIKDLTKKYKENNEKLIKDNEMLKVRIVELEKNKK
ncbi:MAG: hypothetical protein ACYCZ2_02330 [Lutibacter sp.]